MFTQTDIEVANKTSRANGAIGKNAITPRYVREWLGYPDDDVMILDFGAGKTAAHAQALLEDGYNVTAYEFGENIDPRFHDEFALMNKYDVVYASNVLNVQSGFDMALITIQQVVDVLKEDGTFFANFPASPRKSDIKPKEMQDFLHAFFESVERVGGTTSAPLWMCTK